MVASLAETIADGCRTVAEAVAPALEKALGDDQHRSLVVVVIVPVLSGPVYIKNSVGEG